MGNSQNPRWPADAFALHTQRVGALPLINHFLKRLRLEGQLEGFVPTHDRRIRLPYVKGLGVLLRSIWVEREPMYRQQETVSGFSPEAFGLHEALVGYVGDDGVGRALDRLFDADRGTLLTEVVVGAVERFALSLDELYNDSTTVRFCGQYRQARGRKLRGKRAPFITHGYSKDHRPDLKQLLFIVTTGEDGGCRCSFAANTATPTTRARTSRPGRPCAGQRGEETFSTLLTPSCVPASPWTTSTDAVDASCV
jgi:hypothetical protein